MRPFPRSWRPRLIVKLVDGIREALLILHARAPMGDVMPQYYLPSPCSIVNHRDR
jgi:hypothetical protein